MRSLRRLASLLARTLALHASVLQVVSAQTPDALHRIEIGGTGGVRIIAVAGARLASFCLGQTDASVHRSGLGFRAGYRLTRRLVVEGTVERVSRGPDNTISCPYYPYPQRPRETGADTLTTDNPSWFPRATITTARAELIPWARSWAEARLYAGLGRLWQLHEFSAVAGLQGRVRIDRLSLITEAEAARYGVPFTHSTGFYLDGLFVRRETTRAPSKGRIDATFRFGLAVTL
jgi:hypothetical protein